MLLLDAITRYPTVGLLLWFVVLLIRDGGDNPAVRYAALLMISITALLLGTPHPEFILPTPAHYLVRFLDVANVALVWWFGLALFKDDFRPGKLEWLGMGITVVVVLMFRLEELGMTVGRLPYLEYVVACVSTLMMVHLVAVIMRDRHDDVIEARRKMRFFFVIGLVVVTLSTVIGERIFAEDYPIELSIFRSLVILPLVVWGLLWLTRFDRQKLSFAAKQELTAIAFEIDPRDKSLHQLLISEMENNHVYTEPGLTIRTLAEKLGTPEHRLRALINKGMGYRNFSGFLNQYRIKAVKQAMQRSENTRTPILSIALAVGFNSIAPFNRAFSSITGQTPTEYRAEWLKKT